MFTGLSQFVNGGTCRAFHGSIQQEVSKIQAAYEDLYIKTDPDAYTSCIKK